ncbi:MAG TPA: glycosyltransferase, partial [Nitriliruptorales bacterium]
MLLVHDDLALVPDAVQWLVSALEADPDLAVVGPKLREWSEERLLQQVGMSADAFGRTESGLEPGELDQGQRDGQRDVLYVSTAGMMLRRDVFRTLGGFDARFDAFRDDLDLCWRVWLSGRRVAVVTDAIGYHIAASASGLRGEYREHPAEARYKAERHTIAALLKNYSVLSLVVVVPVAGVLNLARIAGFVLARRFSDALAVVRAYAWNVLQLPATLRRRAVVQRARRARDRDLRHLFAPAVQRLGAYAEAMADWVTGGGPRALVDPEVEEPRPEELAEHPFRRFLRDRPVLLLGVPTLLALLASMGDFFGPGQIVGGTVAPWPDAPMDFLRSYLSAWDGEPLASASFPSPIQAVLGVFSLAGFGSAWLAQRLALFGLVVVAWLLALRAGRLVTGRGWPRVVGATVYVLSPALLGAVSEGRWGTLVVGALLPGVVLTVFRAGATAVTPGTAWRSAALLSLGIVVSVSASPVDGLLVLGLVAVAVLLALLRGAGRALL